MSEELVTLEHKDDGVAIVTLTNGKVNALSSGVVRRLHEIGIELGASPPGAVVVTGGEKIFAAGADISEFGGADEAGPITVAIHGALDAIAAIPRMVIAAVSGYALGGGCELALACDYRIAGERAVFGQPEILLGVIPGGGGTQRMARLIGTPRTKDLIFTGRMVGAAEALEIGLVDQLVPAAEVYDTARAWAAQFVKGPALALAAAKKAIDGGLDTDLRTGLDLEAELFAALFSSADRSIGMESFMAHGPGKAEFTGR
jgi:enoyl-CoA hydratase